MITEQFREKVKQLFKEKNYNGNTIKRTLQKHLDIKQQLQKQFENNKKIYNSLGKLVILICQNIELKRCKACNKIMSYDRTIDPKSKYCSNKCKLSAEQNNFSKPQVKEKIKQTCLQKYGVENPSQNKQVQQKKKNTIKQKYGTTNLSNLDLIKEKIKQTKIQKYGTTNLYSNPIYRQKMIRSKYDTTYEKLKERIKKDNLQPFFKKSDFIGTNHKYMWRCTKCGHIFPSTYHDGIVYSRCFVCHPKVTVSSSKYQKQLVQFIKQFNLKILTNDRVVINPLELDIVLPQIKVAIQFNGMYWHSSKYKAKNYHLNKTQLCQQAGYRLIHVFEWEWRDKQQIVKQKLKSIICRDIPSIYGRKCTIKQISSKQKNQFLNKHHIQGQDRAEVKLGLIHQNQLVAVMTFCKPRFSKQYQWELSRYATSKRVIGGAGKLLKYFENTCEPKSIVTYADRRYSIGNLYDKLGFKLDHISEPNYFWIKEDVMYSRYQCQKQKLKQLLGEQNFDQKLSQKQNMIKNQYTQVFDCGNFVYTKRIDN